MKKLVTLSLVLLLCLSVIGGSAAYWTQALDIDGSVGTGELRGGFVHASSNDPSTNTDPGLYGTHALGQYVDYGLHVATTEACIVSETEARIDVVNAYPSYAPMATFKVSGHGTIPAKFERFSFTQDSNYPEALALIGWCITLNDAPIYGGSNGEYSGTLPFPVNETGLGMMTAMRLHDALTGKVDINGDSVIDGKDWLIIPPADGPDSGWLDIHFVFHVVAEESYQGAQDAPELATISITAEAEIIQFNDDGSIPPTS